MRPGSWVLFAVVVAQPIVMLAMLVWAIRGHR